jgi:hypothetical protein
VAGQRRTQIVAPLLEFSGRAFVVGERSGIFAAVDGIDDVGTFREYVPASVDSHTVMGSS